MKETKATRRRGASLEDAILDAAWCELAERGYAEFTLDGVASRAGTSRPVLHRRWPGRAELAKAALFHHHLQHPLTVPDLGSVRDELVSLLRELSARGAPTLVTLMLRMSEYFAETKSSYADLKNEVARTTLIDDVLQRGVARGEIDAAKLTPRIASLPFDLARHEVIMTMEPVPDAVIEEIVDEIFLPLVRP